MASEFFSDIASTVLSKSLDASASRQKSIANNIANVETPGYKRSYVDFETALKRIMDLKGGHDKRQSLRELEPVRRTDVVSPAKPDGNNVNIDAEIADLAKTQGTYKAATTLLEAKIALLRTAIKEGK
ncbi:MAG: flagellar basal body rod protein FlgB [Armatimonadota bacterium]